MANYDFRWLWAGAIRASVRGLADVRIQCRVYRVSRSCRRRGEFIPQTRTVARPVGVRPTIRMSTRRKGSSQR